MHRPIRHQGDDLGDEYSTLSAIAFNDPSLTRQEDKDAADINNILRRFGVGVQQRQPIFGDVDYDVDLQRALDTITTTRNAFDRLPEDLRNKYGTWQNLLAAMESGQLKIDIEELEAAKPPEERAPTGPPNVTDPQ